MKNYDKKSAEKIKSLPKFVWRSLVSVKLFISTCVGIARISRDKAFVSDTAVRR